MKQQLYVRTNNCQLIISEGSDFDYSTYIDWEITTAYSCCGFLELNDIYLSRITWNEIKEHLSYLIPKIHKQWAADKIIHLAAHIPDRKKWKYTHMFLTALGFKRTISLPSRMERARYTNTRYEWTTPGAKSSQYIKECPFENYVPALAV